MRAEKNQSAAVKQLEAITSTRRTVVFGFIVVSIFLASFIAWGGSVPLATAALAKGVVGVEGHKKQIQHFEGGIVESINVRDGDVVEKGTVLVTLDDLVFRSKYNELRTKFIQISAEFARWSAEFEDAEEVSYPAWFRSSQEQSIVQAAVNTQNDIHSARLSVLEKSLSSFRHKRSKADEESNAAKVRVKNLTEKRRLIEAELSEYRTLEKKGLVTRRQLFDLQKQMVNLELDIGESRSIIKVAEQDIAQGESEVAEHIMMRRKESAEKRTEVEQKLDSLKQQLTALKSQLERTRIEAPISGYIINSTVNTIGGVVSPGAVIMEIMPKGERLLIEGRVASKDRDSIRVGQQAEVRFNAFSRRSTLPVSGTVALISADSVIDRLTQTPYYVVSIELQEDPSVALNGEEIFPGMQAEILIVTGKQTFLEYLAAPVARSFDRAFREN